MLGCKQRDLVSWQCKKYPRLKRAVIAWRNEWAVLSPLLPAQVLCQPKGLAQDLVSSWALWCSSWVLPFLHPDVCFHSGRQPLPPPPSPWCLANWLLLFYHSASGSPTWLIFYSPSSFEETSCPQRLGSWGRPSQPWLVPLCLLKISMPCRTFTLSCLCLLFLFLIFIIGSLLPEGFMQQDIICNTTHDPITKPFSYFIACCSKTFGVYFRKTNSVLSGCAPAHKDVVCDHCVEHNAQKKLITALFVCLFFFSERWHQLFIASIWSVRHRHPWGLWNEVFTM